MPQFERKCQPCVMRIIFFEFAEEKKACDRNEMAHI